MMKITVPISCLLLCIASGINAQQYYSPSQQSNQRIGPWEFALQYVHQDDESIDSRYGATATEVDSQNGWGFRLGYNFNNRLNLSFEANSIKPRYSATLPPAEGETEQRQVRHKLTMTNFNLNLGYFFFDGPISPFVQAGIGRTHIDSNISDGNYYTGCWWDPWWGYVCSTYGSTYDASGWSYNAAAGLNWDITDTVFLRGSISRQWLDLNKVSKTPEFDSGKFELGYRF